MRPARRIRSVGLVFALATLSFCGEALAQIDLSGEWTPLLHEDIRHRLDEPAPGTVAIPGWGGPRIGDYMGLPLNDAGRLKADSWDSRINSLPEHQTIGHPAGYWVYAAGGMRISKVFDEATERVVAWKIYRVGGIGSATRTIWMDGRSHPPEYAAHTWLGFSTGTWTGDALTVTTTHLKAGWIRRNGVPTSDQATMSEHIVRHAGYLTIIRVLTDPIYLEEPLIASSTWLVDPRQELVEPPPSTIVDELRGAPVGFVPHHLPGTNTALTESASRVGLPLEATRGGKETTYPEYQQTLDALIRAQKEKGAQ